MVRGENCGGTDGMVVDMQRRRTVMAGVLAGALVLSLVSLSTSSAAPSKDLKEVAQQVRELQMAAEAAHERASNAQARLNGISSELDAIQNKAERERADLRMAMTTIDDIARAAYSSGGMDPTLEVLMADDPGEFLVQAAVMSQLQQTQIAQLRRAQTTRLRLAQTEAEISDRESSAQQARDEMAAAQSDAAAQLDAAEEVLAGLQEEERQRLEKLAEERRQQQIADAAAAAKAAQDAQDAAASTNGSGDNGGSSGDSGGSSGGGAAESGGGFTGGSRAQVAIQYALAQVGDPYSYSANPPTSWDCSKLTTAAWAQAGVGLTAISYAQFDQTQRIPVSDIQPGDLVFYFGSGAHHVGMYIGGGKMVHAANPSDGVEITDFLGPWYGDRFSGVGRVIG